MPRSRSSSMSPRNCSDISRAETAPVRSSRRSASVDFPWSMWAMMEKLRMRAVSRSERIYGRGTRYATERRSARSKPLHRPPEPVLERHLGPPAEDLGRAPRVDHAPPLLALLRRTVPDLRGAPARLEQVSREGVDVGLDAGPDVERPGGRRLECEEVRPH